VPPSRLSNRYATWVVLVLPHLEQDAIYRAWDLSRTYYEHIDPAAWTASLKVFFCPTRRAPPSVSRPGLDQFNNIDRPGAAGDYACGGGDRVSYGNELDQGGNGAMIQAQATIAGGRLTRWTSLTRLSALTDGTSSTLLVGERHVPVGRFNNQIGDGSIYNGDHHRTLGRVGGPGYPGGGFDFSLASGPTDVQGGTDRWQRIFGSYHPSLCQFVFADGSVRSLPVSIAPATLRLLVVRNDGQAAPEF
jgi:hypothetical protein